MADNKTTVYLAGKITGDPNYRKKFERARKELERAGYIVLDPSILPPTGFEYAAYIRMSTAMLYECAAVCLLPDWIDSQGAMCEKWQALTLGKIIFNFDDWRRKHGGERSGE